MKAGLIWREFGGAKNPPFGGFKGDKNRGAKNHRKSEYKRKVISIADEKDITRGEFHNKGLKSRKTDG